MAGASIVLALLVLAPVLCAPPPGEFDDHRDPFQELSDINDDNVGAGTILPPEAVPWPAVTDVTHPRCTGYICGIEMCLPIEDCDGEVRPNATECGCCPLCIQYLDEGRACGRHGILRFPAEPTTVCRPPLRCVDGYCVSPEASGAPVRRRPRKQKPLPSAVDALERVLFGVPR